MAKDPAFLFYPNDWIGGTMGMTFEEKGIYMELLILQFNRGHMTSHMIGQAVGQNWDKVKDKFKKDTEGRWYNERLDTEKDRRLKFTESRRNNKKGTNQYTKKEGGHMIGHMETENINSINSGIMIFDIQKYLKENRKDLEIICSSHYVTEKFANMVLEKFHLWNQENDKYPKKPMQLIAGLKKWIINEKRDKPESVKESVDAIPSNLKRL
jgi:uncharacterized protein YdaU (DUF1376 family)